MAGFTLERSSDRFDYRPHLDGLRAVAVYLVVLFHAGVSRFEGGFIGVDVFFVLSGFLVTSLLVGELRDTSRVSLLTFYARRARRLLPAAGLGLVVTAAVYALLASPLEQVEAAPGVRWAALYVSNWWFIRESADYFGTDVASSPVAHYWSLSVEEQFYVLWPLALLAIWWVCGRLRERPLRSVRAVVAILGCSSLAAALLIARHDLDRAYYGTDTRAYQLLAGALLALTPGLAGRLRRNRSARLALPWASVAGLVALVLLGSSVLDLSPIARGALVAGISVMLLAVLEGSERGPVRWLLERPSLVYLGRISYGTYLWHWLVILVLVRTWGVDPVPTALVAVAVATGLASISYHLLEMPIRASRPLGARRARSLVVGVGVAMSLVVGLVVTPAVLDGRPRSRTVDAAPSKGGTPVRSDPIAARGDRVSTENCESGGPVLCPLVGSGSRKAILVGDSHAEMLAPVFVELAQTYDLELVVGYLPYCPWTRGVQDHFVGKGCLEDQDDLFGRMLPEFDPEIVILAHRALDDPMVPHVLRSRDGEEVAEEDQQAVLDQAVTSVIGELRADERIVVIIEPVPVVDKDRDPTACLSASQIVEPCRFVTSTTPTGEEQTIRRLAEADEGVVALDLDRLVCPYHPICDPVVDDVIVRSDDNHLTRSFAMSLLDEIELLLLERGVLD